MRNSNRDVCYSPFGASAGAAVWAVTLLVSTAATSAAAPSPWRMAIDETKVTAEGLRRLTSKHLTLYTDVPAKPEVDELPAVFDLAVPQWRRYFGVEQAIADAWHVTGFLVQEADRLRRAGLMPADLPPFPNGYQRGRYFWLYDQTADYYRRELLLHEGTHAFMNHLLGGLGPPWYAEGTAELLGTHRWDGRTLTLAYIPRDKTESPGWGRIKIVLDEVAAGRGMMPGQIMQYGPTAHQKNEPYGWCWALAAFLEYHPRYQQAFRGLHGHIRGDVTQAFRDAVGAQWPELCEEWQLFVMNLDYGYDVARAAVERKPGTPLPTAGVVVTIAADRGWQSTGVLLEAGTTYRLEAAGRYQIGASSAPWWCEPGGVTIHYHKGRPLGELVGAVRPDDWPTNKLTPLARPQPFGLQRDLTPTQAGTLYLKINESAANLADNHGEIKVRVGRQ